MTKIQILYLATVPYTNPKVIAVAFLGFSSGLPRLLTLSTLGIWMTEAGVSLTNIGLFAFVGTPYAIKFLWAPFVDHIPFFLTRKFGRRRGWLILSQVALVISIICLGASNPSVSPLTTAFFALLVAISSATQDIVIDAYRVEILDDNQQGAGAAVIVFGYRIGMLVAGAGALVIATYFDWFITYCIMALFVPVGLIAAFFVGEPCHPERNEVQSKDLKSNSPEILRFAQDDSVLIRWNEWFNKSVIEPFRDFTSRTNWILILSFILFYKFGDAFMGQMTNPFLLKLGFTKIEIAKFVKTYGLLATLAGAFIGGSIVHRFGIIKSLWICGFLQMFSNLVFILQAIAGHDTSILILTITIENLSGGMGTAAFVAYLSSLCNIRYTATQYALFSSFSAMGITWFSTSSGIVVDVYGWITFFIISTVLAIPGLLILKKISSSEK